MIDQARFDVLASEGHNRIPLVREVLSDLDTPLSVYLKLADGPVHLPVRIGRGRCQLGALLDHRPAGDARLPVSARHTLEVIEDPVRSVETPRGLAIRSPKIERLRAAVSTCRTCRTCLRSRGGLVGYFGFETDRLYRAAAGAVGSRRRTGHAGRPADAGRGSRGVRQPQGPAVPDRARRSRAAAGVCARAAAAGCAGRTACARAARPTRSRPSGRAGRERLQLLVHPGRIRGDGREGARSTSAPATSSRWCRRNASACGFNARPVDVYRALRALNPSPYMYFVDLGETQIVGSSPEILARLKDGKVIVRPLAGTRRRGAHRSEDLALEARAAGRSQGARRAPDADRPRPQRRRSHQRNRHGAR